MDDEKLSSLFDKARSGDRASLDKILDLVQGRLRAVASARLSRMLRRQMETSDLLQTTYVNVLRAMSDFRGNDPETFVAWVSRIMENTIRDKARFYDREKRKPGAEGVGLIDNADQAQAPGPTPSRQAVDIENLLVVSKALDAMSEDYRQVLVLRMIDGQSYEEIAEALGRTEGATRMLLSRARAALALEMDSMLDENG